MITTRERIQPGRKAAGGKSPVNSTRSRMKKPVVLLVLLALLGPAPANGAVRFSSLFSFDGTNGAVPEATLIQGKDGNLYGTTIGGGTNGVPFGSDGTVFRISTNGEFKTLAFLDRAFASGPQAGLIESSDGGLYGTCGLGGPRDWGAAFRVGLDGAFSIAAPFQWPQLEYPNGLLEGKNGLLYSTGYWGGTNGGYGSIISIDTNGTVAILASFGLTNGSNPQASLASDPQGNLYGTTVSGGLQSSNGTVFQLKADGQLLTLVSFNGTNGSQPMCPLHLEPDGTLYGVTSAGGLGFDQSPWTGNGTTFKITPEGELVTLHYFTGYPDEPSDSSFSGLYHAADGNFYGTSGGGGANANGTIFRMTPSGNVEVLYSFSRRDYTTGTNLDGATPSAGVIEASDGNFYGVTMDGGLYGLGTIFRFSLLPDPPVLQSVAATGEGIAFAWNATKGAAYQVQYTSDLTVSNWVDLGSAILATNSLGSASDAIGSDRQRFYRVILLP